jgi:transcriptional regulator with XRE-family HTH domain
MLSRLKYIRLDKGLSQLQLGILAEVHPCRISLAERKLEILTPEEQKRISKVLETEEEWLFEDAPVSLPFGGERRRTKSEV